MTYETIICENRNGVLLITLNRPDRLNAWTYQMGRELHNAIEAGNDNEAVLAMVLTGSGRGFCAGADIVDLFKAQAESDADQGAGSQAPGNWVELVRGSKPMVAAVNGAAIGVGLTQILPFDYIIGGPSAKFSARFIKMGLVPELASSHFIAARTGFGQANRLMLTGETIDSARALQIGLIDECVTTEAELVERGIALAQSMGDNPQDALRMVKALVTQNLAETDLKKIQHRELTALHTCYKSVEHKEAIDAFINKRPPDFRAARASTSD